MFTKVHRRSEPEASDGDLMFARESDPLRTGLDIGVRVVCRDISWWQRQAKLAESLPTTTESPSWRKSAAALKHLSLLPRVRRGRTRLASRID